jgi:hypothetical protein
VHLAEVPAQLAVVVSPVTLRAQLHLHCFLPMVGSDEDSYGKWREQRRCPDDA